MTLTNPAAESATLSPIDALVEAVFGDKPMLARHVLRRKLDASKEWYEDRLADGDIIEVRLSARKHVVTRASFAEYLRRANEVTQ